MTAREVVALCFAVNAFGWCVFALVMFLRGKRQ
jgi:hypothetical protein